MKKLENTGRTLAIILGGPAIGSLGGAVLMS